MRAPLLLAVLLSAATQAQITMMSVNGDGSALHFASGYSLAGEVAPVPVSRVYKHGSGVPDVLMQMDPSLPDGTISSVFVSDDGRTWGWSTTRVICNGAFCPPSNRVSTVLTLFRNGGTGSLNFSGLISRNGRWIFNSSVCPRPVDLIPMPCASVYDLDTGKSFPLPVYGEVAHPTHSIADDGSLLVGGSSELRLYAPDGSGPLGIPVPGKYRSAAITRDGRKVLLLTDTTLFEIDRATLARREIYSSPDGTLREFSPSAQGERVLLLSGRDVLLLGAGAVSKAYSAPEDVAQILLTADGQTGIVRTARNRVVRVATEGVEELYAPLPSSGPITSAPMVPGSLLQMFGGPFREGQTLSVKGVEFPIVAIEEAKLETQVPWDFERNGGTPYTLRTPGHQFVVTGYLRDDGSYPLTIYRDEKLDDGQTIKAALAGFDSMMSAENPAPPGSTIHFWLMGLGPLDRTLATGQRGPADPPAKPVAPFACYIFRTDNVPAIRGLEIPFAAYGPGLLGVYQVDALIPADWPSGPSTVKCVLGDQPEGRQGRIYVK